MLLEEVEHKINQVLSSTHKCVINAINIPQIRQAIFTEELIQSIYSLNTAIEKSKNSNNPLQDFKAHFKVVCHQRWEWIKNTELSYFQTSESNANALFYELTILLFSPSTLGELYSILMPELKILTFEVVKDKFEIPLSRSNIKILFHIKSLSEELLDPMNKITDLDQFAVADQLLFDLKTIARLPIKEQVLFYNAIKLKYPALRQEIYQHNHDFIQLKKHIGVINKKGLSLDLLIPEVIKQLKQGGEKVTGHTIASVEASYAAQNFITFMDSFFHQLESEIKIAKSEEMDFLSELKKIKIHLEKGECVEEAASALERFVGRFSGSFLFVKNLGLSKEDFVSIEKAYSCPKNHVFLNVIRDKEYRNIAFPNDLLKLVFNSITLRKKDDYASVLTVLPTSYYKLFLETTNSFYTKEKTLSIYNDLLRFNFLNEEQTECFFGIITNYLKSILFDKRQFKCSLGYFEKNYRTKFIKAIGIEAVSKFLTDSDDLLFVLNSVDNNFKIKIIESIDKEFFVKLAIKEEDWQSIFYNTSNDVKKVFFSKVGYDSVLNGIRSCFSELWFKLNNVMKVEFMESVSAENRTFFLRYDVIYDIFSHSEFHLSKKVIDYFDNKDWEKVFIKKSNMFSLLSFLSPDLKEYFLSTLDLDFLLSIDISATEFYILFESVSNEFKGNYLERIDKKNIDNLVSEFNYFLLVMSQLDDSFKGRFWDKVDHAILVSSINNGQYFLFCLSNIFGDDRIIFINKLGFKHIIKLMSSFELLKSSLSYFDLESRLNLAEFFNEINLNNIIYSIQNLDEFLDFFPQKTWPNVIKHISIEFLEVLKNDMHKLNGEKNMLICSEVKNKAFKLELFSLEEGCSLLEIKAWVLSLIKEYLSNKRFSSACAYSLIKNFNKEYYHVSVLYKMLDHLDEKQFNQDNLSYILRNFMLKLHNLNVKIYHGKKLFSIFQMLDKHLSIPFDYCYDASIGLCYLSMQSTHPASLLKARVHSTLTSTMRNQGIFI